MRQSAIDVPSMVRIKPGTLDRMGIYLSRNAHNRAIVFASDGLGGELIERLSQSLISSSVEIASITTIKEASMETAISLFTQLPRSCQVIIGFGGGKALDTAKYIATMAKVPYYAAPTSLSNDGFCSPQSSLTIAGRKKAVAAAMPFGVIIDTEVCLEAPIELWCSGVGDLAAKLTANYDWKLAFRAAKTPINDFAALVSKASVFQFLANPTHDSTGMKLLGTALLLNGIATEICGSSRPASGSEHLISHALDQLSSRPHLHGLQVGVATYIVSCLQNYYREKIAELFDKTGFWTVVEKDRFSKKEWLEAVRIAPTMKDNFYTVLSSRDCVGEVRQLIETDPRLENVFTE